MEWSEPPPLPREISAWLTALGAPPRLDAHLRLVRQAADELLEQLSRRWPKLEVDAAAVRFGAASHDIGKAIHRAELSEPGSAHEEAGRLLLLEHRVGPALARFSVSHAGWKRGEPGELEDLLVALADHCWKGSRPAELEMLACAAIGRRLRLERWEVFSQLDEIISEIAIGADQRLEWQALHGV